MVKQGFIPYGPAIGSNYCSMSSGGALIGSWENKENAKDNCAQYGCNIITELSNGRFELGLTTSMEKCEVRSENIKQQWIKL